MGRHRASDYVREWQDAREQDTADDSKVKEDTMATRYYDDVLAEKIKR